MLPPSLAALVARSRRRLLIHRRLLVGLLTAGAVAASLRTLAPTSPASVELTVAAHDLAAGATLSSADVKTASVPPRAVPDGTVVAVAGRVLAAPVRRGEPITDARLIGPSLTTAAPGLVAVPVRLPDAAMAGLLEAGARIDLYAVAAEDGSAPNRTTGPAGSASVSAPAVQVAAGVLVLAVSSDKKDPGGVTTGLGGRLIVVGVPHDVVPEVAGAAARSFVTFAFSH